LFKSTAQKST